MLGGCAAKAPPSGEGLVYVTERFPGQAELSVDQRQTRFVLGDETRQPPAVLEDLHELGDAIVAQGVNLETDWVLASPNGRSVVACKRRGWRYTGAPTGVWCWPDWRNAQAFIHVPDHSEGGFLSNHHLRIKHHPVDGVGWSSRVIDWRNPNHRFHFADHKPHMIRVADNGRWACETLDGKVATGWLNPHDPQWLQHAIAVPVEGEVSGLMLRNHGSILVVDLNPEESMPGRECVKTFRLTATHAIEAASITAYLHTDDSTLADDSFILVISRPRVDQCMMATADHDGGVTLHKFRMDQNQWIDESPVCQSPSGKYTTTQHTGFFGGIGYVRLRKTPKAGPDDPLPSFPVSHEDIGGGEFWLAWDEATLGPTP